MARVHLCKCHYFFAVGYGDLFPATLATKMVSLVEAFSGVTMTSYFLVLLSRKNQTNRPDFRNRKPGRFLYCNLQGKVEIAENILFLYGRTS